MLDKERLPAKIMAMVDFLKVLAEKADVRTARSTALHPLLWLFAILVTATGTVARWGECLWLTIGIAVATGVVLLMILCVYVYLMITNLDSLRSERYTLAKLAIEHGILGDNLGGTFDTVNLGSKKVLESGSRALTVSNGG